MNGKGQMVRFLSWNVDMSTEPIGPRMHGLLLQIRELKPDVVMLQEVTPISFKILGKYLWDTVDNVKSDATEQNMNSVGRTTGEKENGDVAQQQAPHSTALGHAPYDLHIDPSWPEELPYFCLLLTRRKLFYNPSSSTTRFATSRMYRGYVAASGTISSGANLFIVTSHLESSKDSTVERKSQLLQILDTMRERVDEGYSTFFAGDTNLREAEVPASEIIKKPKAGESGRRKRKSMKEKFSDVWVMAGGSDENKFTWDTQSNDNLGMVGDFRPKSRYDRAFVLSPSNGERVSGFNLVGRERLECGRFISDHWGLCIDMIY
ncbi:Tyrosyl-DNA phosphodiesterase 2 [Gracilariopsis chorda]|uniref:Tyrosyl-DNA phosphodiesterase 2 n=1 Tax=Gracilariopsis chorda TaxID=448386 RepID=A0A2V3IJ22_9FLOR|nr:Tyrosyl-DNA phosphodiesterase 2 [Gracilariopsis chorda]|eukprot:PXF41120.1 Tyrosyl-DNA phosphodiesterase 2 [Gracilariopsis chorda]